MAGKVHIMSKLLATALAVALLAGCAAPSSDACRLIAIAVDEGNQFAEAWYIEASAVLDKCGNKAAAELARQQACAARRFNDSSVECNP